MTGQHLSDVLTLLKGELLLTGTGDDTLLYQMIINTQFWYANRWKWSELEDKWDAQVGGTSQFVTFPTVDWQGQTATMRLDKPLTVETYYLQKYWPVEYGIGIDEYNIFNFANGDTQDPIQKWQRDTTVKTQFEVWPVPATPQTVRFTGQRMPLTVDILNPATTVVDLDDMLLALTVAANYMKSKGKAGWDVKAGMSKELLQQLLGDDPQALTTFRIGRDDEDQRKVRNVPLRVITVHG